MCHRSTDKAIIITGLVRPWGFQEAEAPIFQDSRHVKVVRLSAVVLAAFTPQEIYLVLISVRGWVDPTAIVRPQGLCQRNIPACSAVQPNAPPHDSGRHNGGRDIAVLILKLGASRGLGGQRQAPAALPPRKSEVIPYGRGWVWAPAPVWTGM